MTSQFGRKIIFNPTILSKGKIKTFSRVTSQKLTSHSPFPWYADGGYNPPKEGSKSTLRKMEGSNIRKKPFSLDKGEGKSWGYDWTPWPRKHPYWSRMTEGL